MNAIRSFSKFIPPLTSWNKNIIARFHDAEQVFLTIDDGPHPAATMEALGALSERNLRATFFVVGSEIEKYPDVLNHILAGGHRIENHSFTHRRMTGMRRATLTSEILTCSKLIEHRTGCAPLYFRPPYGWFNRELLALCRTHRQQMLLWNSMPGEYSASRSVEQIKDFFSRNLRAGDIVVIHDNEKTVSKVGAVIHALADVLHTKRLNTAYLPKP